MNYEDIKKLVDDMGASKVDELKIEFPDGIKIEMKKNSTASVGNIRGEISENVVSKQQVNNIVVESVERVESIENKVEEKKQEENCKIVKSPMVGTFYSKPSPNVEPFVKVGDHVKKGQIVCIVEAMKLMNEIESEFDGEVVEVCFKDEDMVEYGSPLIKIK